MRVILLSMLMLWTACMHAAEEHVVILPAGAVHDGDYFAWGSSVEISGTVNGDVYVLAQQLTVEGTINGDLLGAAGSVDVSGSVARNVRVVAGQVLILGQVGYNVTAIGGNLQLLPSAEVGGNIVVIAGNLDLSAQIGQDATIVASNVRLSSWIGKNLQGYMGQMRITSRAQIDGNVDYRSDQEAWIDPGARIGGELIHRPSFVHELVKGTWIQKVLVGSKIIAILMNFLYTLIIGLILLKYFPRNVESALHALRDRPWQALGCGAVILIALPLVSLILLMTILGVPFALTLIAANIFGLYTAKIYSVFWASNRLCGKVGMKPNRIPTLMVGLVLYFLLTSIPYVGVVIALIAMLFGLGAGTLAQTRSRFFTH